MILIDSLIRIYLNSSVLRNGLVLVDLPGKLRSSPAKYSAQIDQTKDTMMSTLPESLRQKSFSLHAMKYSL
jgi:hypothetical protein